MEQRPRMEQRELLGCSSLLLDAAFCAHCAVLLCAVGPWESSSEGCGHQGGMLHTMPKQ